MTNIGVVYTSLSTAQVIYSDEREKQNWEEIPKVSQLPGADLGFEKGGGGGGGGSV